MQMRRRPCNAKAAKPRKHRSQKRAALAGARRAPVIKSPAMPSPGLFAQTRSPVVL